MIPITICAIFRNEALYIKEWLDFHKKVGVSKFYLYNNLSTDNYLEVLQPYMDDKLVELIDWPFQQPQFLSTNNPQLNAYQNFINNHFGENIWTAFIDIDEFLFCPDGESLPTRINHCNRSIGVNWMCFGSSGKTQYENKPVLERFTWRPSELHPVNQHIKSIIRMNKQVYIGGDPHFFHPVDGTFNENGNLIAGPFSPHSSSFFRINHYKTKSLDEWTIREQQGKTANASHKIDWGVYDEVQSKFVDDRTIWQFLN